MNALIVYAHPNPKSFNAALLETTHEALKNAGHEVRVRDLYAMNFNPVLSGADFTQLMNGETPADIKTEQEHVTWADTIFFIFPTWWISMPAMMKGWMDRIFLNGFGYHVTENGPEGLLKGKKVVILQTTGTPEEMLAPAGFINSMNNAMELGTLNFVGLEVVNHKYFYGVPFVPNEVRVSYLEELKGIVKEL